MLATAANATVQLIDLEAANALRTLSGHHGAVNALAFDPGGEVLATGSLDGVVRLWRTATGHPYGGALIRHTGSVTTLGWLAGDVGVALVSAGENETVVWEFGLDAWIARACRAANRQLTPEEWLEFLGPEVPYAETCEADERGTPP